ncbi:MAG: archease [archaeon]
MTFELFEHKADVGIKGTGKTLEEAFQEAGKALFSIMTDIKKVGKKKSFEFEVNADNMSELFIEFLNELLSLKDLKESFFSDFKVKLMVTGRGYNLEGKAFGEKINLKKHSVKTEVKGATYSQLKVEKEKEFFTAECIVDV